MRFRPKKEAKTEQVMLKTLWHQAPLSPLTLWHQALLLFLTLWHQAPLSPLML
jgi:hypothetical protein